MSRSLSFGYNGKQYGCWSRADAEAAGIPAEVLDAAELAATRAGMSCTPRQARLALDAAGLLDDVEAWIATAPRATQIDWEYATRVKRTSGAVADASAALGLSDADIDHLFAAAAIL